MKLEKLAGVLRAIYHPKRLLILALLAEADRDVCVCELVDAMELPQYQVSQHLRELRNENLVRGKRMGTWVYYSLCENDSEECQQVIKKVVETIDKTAYHDHLEKLKERFTKRKNGKCTVGYDEESN